MASSEKKIRATALRHAYDIQDKKRLQAQIADLVVECFDLPTSSSTEDQPVRLSSDMRTFKHALKLFQPSDFDDLVYERNVDDRCGYALCSNPNRKLGKAQKIWNGKSGKDFDIVPRTELERWCSEECARKAAFAKSQLSGDPAWIREEHLNSIKLWEDSQAECNASSKTKAPYAEDVTDRLSALSLERGELGVRDTSPEVSICEKENTDAQTRPPQVEMEGIIEGYRLRKVRFAERDES